MQVYEIVLIVVAVLFVVGVIVGTTVKKYRNKKKGIPACCSDCSSCSNCSGCSQYKDVLDKIETNKK